MVVAVTGQAQQAVSQYIITTLSWLSVISLGNILHYFRILSMLGRESYMFSHLCLIKRKNCCRIRSDSPAMAWRMRHSMTK
jgi:hypothetical protein